MIHCATVGSNIKTPYNRWVKNPESIGKCACYPYFKQFNIENFKMIEIKSYNIHLKDRRCLEAYETLWICKTRGCCNKYLPVKYIDDKEYNRKYYINNKVVLTQKVKQYREDNKEVIAMRKKEYREDNKEKISEYKRQYRKANKTEIAETGKVKVMCDCGSTFRKGGMARHCRSKKHQAYLATQTE